MTRASSTAHEFCATCLHSHRYHSMVEAGACEAEGCTCRAFVRRPDPPPPPPPLTPGEHDEVEALAREIFLRTVSQPSITPSYIPEGVAFSWTAAEAFVRSKAARPPRPASPKPAPTRPTRVGGGS